MSEQLYYYKKRWCSMCNKEHELWYGGIPLARKPDIDKIAEVKIGKSVVEFAIITEYPVQEYSPTPYRYYGVYVDEQGWYTFNDLRDALDLFCDVIRDKTYNLAKIFEFIELNA